MIHVIERIVNLLAAEAGEITAESALGTLLRENIKSFHNNTIHSITNTAGDYTIEFSKNGNITHFTMNLTIYAGHTPTEYVGKGLTGNFVMIKTEQDLVSYMANAQ